MRPIHLRDMVHFSNPRLGGTRRLTVCSAGASDGYRLIVKYPDGRRRVHHTAPNENGILVSGRITA